jgi:transporter family protein
MLLFNERRTFHLAFWAAPSAVFAAMTAIFAKVGVDNVNPDFATFIRTIVILLCLAVILTATGQFQSPGAVSGRSWPSWVGTYPFLKTGAQPRSSRGQAFSGICAAFLLLSGLATGASWICYFRALKLGPASLVAPIDKLSVVLVAVFGVAFLGERMTGVNWMGSG